MIARGPGFSFDCSEREKRFQGFEVFFGPASDFRRRVDVGDESKKNHRKDCGKRMENTTPRTRTGNLVETINNVREGRIFES